ncbi:MAG: hypothetical protein SV201_08490 [Pseudomonadota bacterium]|nr:hypothetical protein [Pseudomonadota bacterium]
MIDIEISRLTINLHGVSATLAEQAVDGLEQELHRRLGVLARGDLASYDVAELSLGPVYMDTQADAAALRSLLVDRLIMQIQRGYNGEGIT